MRKIFLEKPLQHSRHLLFCCMISVLFSLGSRASAQSTPPTTPEVQAYMLQKYAEALSQQPAILSNAISGDYSTPRDLPYQGGNNIVMVPIQMVLDLVNHIVDFYAGGHRWGIIGICRKCSIFGCSFYPYQEYHYPYEMVEIAGMFQGQYSIDLILTLFRQIVDQFYEDQMEDLIPSEIQKALDISKGNIHTPFDDGNIPGVNLSALGVYSANDRMKFDIADQAGGQQRQYHFFSPLTHSTGLPQAFLGNCHDRPDPGFNGRNLRSDNPVHILQTHQSEFGDILFPDAGLAMQVNPALCSGHNLAQTVTQPLPFVPTYLPVPAQRYCHERLGPLYPIVTRMGNIRSFFTGARTALLRGDQYFRHMDFSKQDFAYYKSGNREIDTVQWHFPDEWSDDPDNPIEADTDFRSGGYHPETRNDGSGHHDDPWRAVATIWKYIRCCPGGMSPLTGPRPQLKGLHDFDGDYS